MPINPNIAMGVNPVQYKQRDPYEEFSKQSQLQALIAGQADDELTRTAMRESGGDSESMLKRLISGGGSLKAVTGVQKMIADQAAAKSKMAHEGAQTGKLLSETETAGIAKHRDMLSMVRDPQTAAQWIQMGYADPVIGKRFQSLVPMDQAIQSIPQDPAEFQSWVQKQGLGATKFIELNKPSIHTQNLGGNSQVSAIPGLGGAPSILSTSPITQTADNLATNTRTAADAAAGRSVTMRGQNMTDSRARELNETTKSLGNQEKQLRIQELQGKIDDKNRGKDASVSSIENQIGVIDKALKHPGRETATGLSGVADPRNYIWGTNAADFKTVLDQIGGAAFLQAFESLKGGGAITEVEGKKATDAMARLNRAQSDDEFKSSLDELRGVMTTGYKRLSGKDYAGQPPKPAGGPKAGTVENGYRFKGGNPADKSSWEKM